MHGPSSCHIGLHMMPCYAPQFVCPKCLIACAQGLPLFLQTAAWCAPLASPTSTRSVAAAARAMRCPVRLQRNTAQQGLA